MLTYLCEGFGLTRDDVAEYLDEIKASAASRGHDTIVHYLNHRF